MLAELISFGPAPNKAIVGTNAFAHEAGIHQHGVLANPLTYEIMTPGFRRCPQQPLVLGKHSGRRALRSSPRRARLPLSTPPISTSSITRFTELADRKKAIYDQDLIGLLRIISATRI